LEERKFVLSPIQKTAITHALKFLEELSEQQGNAGCNDFQMPNTDENWAMYARAVYANGDKPMIEEFEAQGRPKGKMITECQDHFMVYAVKLYLKDML